MPEKSGTSASTGNPWKVQSYVIETHDQYPKKMCFDVFGEDKIKTFNIQIGQELTVSFDIDAHEYNGRWYNSIRAWKVAPAQQDVPPVAAAPADQPAAAPIPAAAPAQPATGADSGDSGDDLPF